MNVADLAQKLAKKLASANEQAPNEAPEDFCARRLWVRPKEGGQIVKFQLRDIQKVYLRKKADAIAKGKPKRFILLKYRRGGFSTLEQALHYKLVVNERYMSVATLAHTKDGTDKISKIAKLFRKHDTGLPAEARKDDDRVSLTFDHTHSTFHLGTAGGLAFGRGDTLQRVHGSEVAFWCEGPNQYEDIDKLIAGLKEATSAGEVVLESTPNGINWFCVQFRDAMKGLNDWTPIFLRWFDDVTNTCQTGEFVAEEILDTLTEEEKDKQKLFGLTLGQIAWRRAKILSLKRLFKQEYPEDPDTCFLSSGTPFFDLDVVLALLESHDRVKGLYKQWREQNIPGGTIVYTEPPEPGKRYVVAVDASEGLAHSDPCVIACMDHETGSQIAWYYGRWRPETTAKHAADLAIYYNNALVAIERQNHGHSVLNTIQNVIGYRNLFYSKNERGQPGPSPSGVGRLGWDTNVETRPIMLDELETRVREISLAPCWRQRDFLSECTSFKLQSDGQYRADEGAHDDTVMAWAIANQVRKYSRHKARVIILD